jgi:hypothetical protein
MVPDPGTVYSYKNVTDYLSEMSTLYKDKVIYKNSTSIQTFSINSSSSYKKAKILFVSSIHGGFPLSTSLSLTLINNFLESSSKDTQDILNTTQLVFIPVANPVAYLLFEELIKNGEEPLPIFTGLEGQYWNCSSIFAGIDPDLNFDASFEMVGERCDEIGYSGESSQASEITSFISEQYFSDPPDLTFLFDHEGSSILYPPTASSSSKPEAKAEKYYQSQNFVENNTQYGQFSLIENEKPGTLLEYANSLKKLAYLVNVDPPMDSSSNETHVSQYLGHFFHSSIISLVSGVNLEYLYFNVSESSEDSSNSTSDPNETIHFFFKVNSSMYLDCDVNFEVFFDFEGSHDYEFVNLTRKESFSYKDNVINTTLTTSTVVGSTGFRNTSFTLAGLSENLLEFVFSKEQDKGKVEFEFHAVLRPINGGIYFERIDVENEGEENDHHDGHGHGNDKRRAAILGGVLLIVLLILLGIAGLILYFTRKRRN